MGKFKLEDYTTVEERLKLYREDYPDYSVMTEILHYTPDDKIVIKATLYRDNVEMEKGTFHSTGIAEETPEGYVNKTSRVENCETSAVGRALANAGYTGKGGRPSREEMEKVERLSTKKEPTKPKPKKEEPSPEPDDKQSLEVDDEIIAKLQTFTKIEDTIEWYNTTMGKAEDKQAFNDMYMPHIQAKITELRSG